MPEEKKRPRALGTVGTAAALVVGSYLFKDQFDAHWVSAAVVSAAALEVALKKRTEAYILLGGTAAMALTDAPIWYYLGLALAAPVWLGSHISQRGGRFHARDYDQE